MCPGALGEDTLVIGGLVLICPGALGKEEEETLFDPKCTIHHISDAKLDIKQYTHIYIIYIHMQIHAHTAVHIHTSSIQKQYNINILWGR